jgi:uncharacterized protein
MRARKPLGRRVGSQDRPKLLSARRATHGRGRRAHRPRPTASGVLALRRSLAKAHPRVVGVDDGAFARGDRTAPIAAVLLSAPEHVEAVRTDRVRVDGRDATRRVIAVVRASGPLDGVRAVLLDGAVLGGFNVVDLDAVYRALGRPVVAVTRRAPEFAKIRAALRKWFPKDAGRRYRLLTAHRLFSVPTGGRPILAAAVGCTRADAVHLLHRTTVRGYWPEPLRLAHLVASAGRALPAGRGLRAKH